MLRNIDSCEALIFTVEALFTADGELRSGCRALMDDAAQQGTLLSCIGKPPAYAALTDIRFFDVPSTSSSSQARDQVDDNNDALLGPILAHFHAFSTAREAVTLTPEGFGGSDGFGQRPTSDTMARPPEPQWCVAFVTCRDACEGAQRAGMRAVGLPPEDGEAVVDELEGVADACLDDLSELVGLDDLATPGSYWLNPCMPRDAEGFAVDPRTGRRYESSSSSSSSSGRSADASEGPDGSSSSEDAAADAILRDMLQG